DRVAGDELRIAFEFDPRLGLQHPHGCERDRDQRRLRILGERHTLGRAFPHHGRELVAERRIDLLEGHPGRGKVLRQPLTHPDGLAALPRKHESDRHPRPFCPAFGPKTLARSALSRRGLIALRQRTGNHWTTVLPNLLTTSAGLRSRACRKGADSAMSRYALVTDAELLRARQDPAFRHQLLAGNLEFLLEELNRLRRAGPDPKRARQIKE